MCQTRHFCKEHITMATVAAKSVEDTLYTNSYTHILASGLVVPERLNKVRHRRKREMVHVHVQDCALDVCVHAHRHSMTQLARDDKRSKQCTVQNIPMHTHANPHMQACTTHTWSCVHCQDGRPSQISCSR